VEAVRAMVYGDHNTTARLIPGTLNPAA